MGKMFKLRREITKEKWKSIDGYDNYIVSTKGRVRSLGTGIILKHQKSKRGGLYPFINLYKNGKRKNKRVHTLVADAFLGKRQKGYVAHHKDHDRQNPELSNLEYVTHAENRVL
jgi:hypothetical protein